MSSIFFNLFQKLSVHYFLKNIIWKLIEAKCVLGLYKWTVNDIVFIPPIRTDAQQKAETEITIIVNANFVELYSL